MKIRKGDQILVISGKYRNKKSGVLRAFPKKRKIVVEGVNLVKRHQKPKRTGEKGQTVEMPLPIDISNVKLICPKCGKATRVGCKIINNKKYRICKKCGREV